jgi:signal-transduction protein with cAMP-binding, CBS, and nucleotidyltransferase domain
MKTISQFLDQSNRPVYSIDQCMQIMTDKHIRHLPIVNDTQVMGLISIGDVVREMIAYQKSMIEQLQSYIAG